MDMGAVTDDACAVVNPVAPYIIQRATLCLARAACLEGPTLVPMDLSVTPCRLQRQLQRHYHQATLTRQRQRRLWLLSHHQQRQRWSSTSAAPFQAAQQAVLFSMLAQDMELPAPLVVRATAGIAMATRLALTMLVAFAALTEVVVSVSTILTDPTPAWMDQHTSQSIGSSKFQTASTTSRSCSQRGTTWNGVQVAKWKVSTLAAATAIVKSPRPLRSPTANSRLLGTATIRDFASPSARWQSRLQRQLQRHYHQATLTRQRQRRLWQQRQRQRRLHILGVQGLRSDLDVHGFDVQNT